MYFLQTLKAMEVGKRGKVHVEDIVFLIRKDPKKYARVKVSICLEIADLFVYCSTLPYF